MEQPLEVAATVTIPHATQQYVNPDYGSMQFEDTQKGLLAFGDLALAAELKTWEMFQPPITAVSSEYKVETAFE
ncbi:hypothetical protein [Paratractidigestivibacter sp.]|uniref:hypothetical protein n=1 Tax=Paratractidigestivibacter sp. TaxID=2847316 RepID=UPI002ABE31A4|nr:hypothetical protein [Paratractidigestivibacter sp.]